MLENTELNGTTYRRKVDALLTAGAANIGCSKYSVALGHLGNTLACFKKMTEFRRGIEAGSRLR